MDEAEPGRLAGGFSVTAAGPSRGDPNGGDPNGGDPNDKEPNDKEPNDKEPKDWRELVTVVLLSVTAVLTAWTGFQASKWGGAMSISFSQASSARIEASRYDAAADRALTIQVQLFTQWLQAYQSGDKALSDFLSDRFPEPLHTAFPVWLASQPLKNPDAAATPFDLAEFAIPEVAAAKEADARADSKFLTALVDNQRGDNYTVLTIGFAAVLFFAAMSGRLKHPGAQWVLLGLGVAGFVVCAALLLTFPKLV
ncbi:hypothetical protein [Nakamurella lactea]|uniref:hypothetical protein n=1 Tax=Nakamurella lactea TaxID=459515 RepID=UPI000410EDA2|nr:hypothetical protein [Nakamurella lactea]